MIAIDHTMEKIISSHIYSTGDMKRVASFTSQDNSCEETLYFSADSQYLLHCKGKQTQFKNSYGTKSFNLEDLIILDEEDVIGWLDVHAPTELEALYSGFIHQEPSSCSSLVS